MLAVTLDGSSLDLEQVVQVSRMNAPVVISSSALEKTAKGRRALEKMLDEKDVIYGVNTGFGALSDQKIPREKLEDLQTNLIRSHAASVGPAHPRDIVRALMLLRANTLLKGYSGVRPDLPEAIVTLLNKQVHPFIPEKGSVGASGDLSPLSHMALVLIGEGGAEHGGEWVTGTKGLELAGRRPLVLGAKEGLALNNGTQQMLAIGSLVLSDAYSLLRSAEAALALSLEAMRGWTDAFDHRIQEARPHHGQGIVAGDVNKLLRHSGGVRSITHDRQHVGKPQDPYSFRCAPQVMGAALDAIDYVRRILEIEMNSATDNPLVFADDEVCLSGGNFHGQPVSMAMDVLSLALSTLSNISERRVAALLDPSLNNGLPPFLVGKGSQPGLSSGFMAVQYTATALVAENKILTHPASSDSIPTSSNFEDFVSMGPGAAQKASRILENSEYVIAIELLTAAQGVDLRDSARLGDGTMRVHRLIRDHVKTLTEDRSSHEDIEEVRNLVKIGKIADIVTHQLSQGE
jgi:histidine ammonia-lyase